MPTRRRQNPRGEGERLREEFLEAAEHLLVARGSQAAVTVAAICAEVGCTPPALYRLFADKNTLLLDVCNRLFDRYREAVAAAERRTRDPQRRLLAITDAYIAFALDNPGVYRVLFMHGAEHQPGTTIPAAVDSGARMFAHLQESVATRLPGVDAHDAAASIWSVVHGVASLVIAKPDFPWPGGDGRRWAHRSARRTVEQIVSGHETGRAVRTARRSAAAAR